jgi:hypothetical protein
MAVYPELLMYRDGSLEGLCKSASMVKRAAVHGSETWPACDRDGCEKTETRDENMKEGVWTSGGIRNMGHRS